MAFDQIEREISVLDTESETMEVTVYTANVTGADRTFTINVDESSTMDASAYNFPETVTVPANTNEVTFSIEIVGSDIDDEGDVLVLELQEDATLSAGDPLTIDVIKFVLLILILLSEPMMYRKFSPPEITKVSLLLKQTIYRFRWN